MDELPKVSRHDNRDGFRLAMALIVLLALFAVVAGIAAWNSRFMLMPIVPREQLPPIKPAVQRIRFAADVGDIITPAGARRTAAARARFSFSFRGGWRPCGGSSVTTPAVLRATECTLAAGSTLREGGA